MLLSRKWLSEFVEIDADDRAYAESMTMSGSKVEATKDLGAELRRVVVGRVLDIRRHENLDHLHICSVNVGEGEPLTIVTGAQNVCAGDLVPVALDGALLPGGKEIRAGELRGVRSEGMLCSLKELGLTVMDFPYAVEDGIFVLQEDCRPGDDIRPVVGLNDHVVEFEITSNRPDCLSVIGLARESAATFGKELKLHIPQVKGSGGDIKRLLEVEIAAPDLCPRYTARMVRNVRIQPSPRWMRERLRASGVRPINNIVDITNYVMLEYGQPMHAFDFSCVRGGKIVVRRAWEGETMHTLDGNLRVLNPNMLMIADTVGSIGVAGVMGGQNSEITGDTTAVVFESANFNGPSIRKTATALGMRTDASGRFEKGLDPLNTLPAVQRACELVELLGAGEVVDGVIDVVAADYTPVALKLEPDKINRLLGTNIPEQQMGEMLRSLGFVVENGVVHVPSWRGDVEHYSDLAEEVARLYGYNRIPTTLMRGETTQGGLSETQHAVKELGVLCRGMGFSEILTYSFVSPSSCDKIRMPADDPRRAFVTILNPLGEDTSIMRTTSLPSMLETLARNISYRNKAARLYEMATVYPPSKDGPLADEKPILTLGAYGAQEDFFRLKGAVEAVLDNVNAKEVSFAAEQKNEAYHPGRCAAVMVRGERVGVLGQIHPLVADAYGVDEPLYAAELDVTKLLSLRAPQALYRPLPRYPAVSRDIAVLCRSDIPVAALESCIKRGAGALLREITLFDVYTGAQVPEGKKSVAFSLGLRADDRTLTDLEADAAVAAALEALRAEFGAELR
jgi:phenylalanyl-tRNA synthetase beta chain